MPRYGFSYRLPTLPITLGLGLAPPLTYAAVEDGVLRIRFGLWFRLDAPLDAIGSADEARGDLPAAPTVGATSHEPGGYSRLMMRTAKGPLVRIRFLEPQTGRWLVGLPSVRPQVALLRLNVPQRVDEIAITVQDPRGLLDALGAGAIV